MSRSSFKSDVEEVLRRKGAKVHSKALDELVAAVEDNKRSALNKVRVYKYSGLFLLTAIPVTSAVLSGFIGTKDTLALPEDVLFYISLFLTLCTILNSIFRPRDRFREACMIGIGVQAFATNFVAELEKMHAQGTERELAEFAEKKLTEFQKTEVDLISMLMPQETAAKSPDGMSLKIFPPVRVGRSQAHRHA